MILKNWLRMKPRIMRVLMQPGLGTGLEALYFNRRRPRLLRDRPMAVQIYPEDSLWWRIKALNEAEELAREQGIEKLVVERLKEGRVQIACTIPIK